MEPKHIVFFALLFFGVPLSAFVMSKNERLLAFGFFAMVVSIPFVYSTGINFFTDEFYKGTVRGYEVLATDLVSVSVLWALSMRGHRNVFFPRGSMFYILYFAVSCMSIINADNKLYSGYVVQQMVLHFVFFVSVYNCLIYFRSFDIILSALGIFIIFTFFHMLAQRLVFGVYQPSGIFIHRNSTAMFANMLVPVFLSAILNRASDRRRFVFNASAFLCSAFIVVLSLSRGAILFLPVSTAIVVFFSLKNSVNARKIKILAAMLIVSAAAFIRAAPMVVDRFENAPETSAQGRVAFAHAALNMANDKFFGVGLNNWGLKINPPYPYWEDTGIRRPYEDFKSGIVETIYLLVAAECGWIGLAALAGWLLFYYFQTVLNIKRFSKSAGFFMAVGILGGLTAAYGQSCFEWILKQQTNSYLLMLAFACVAAMSDSWSAFNKKSA